MRILHAAAVERLLRHEVRRPEGAVRPWRTSDGFLALLDEADSRGPPAEEPRTTMNPRDPARGGAPFGARLVAAGLGLLLAAGAASGQGRTLRRIEPPRAQGDAAWDPSLPSRLECEQAVLEIAAAYGPDDLEPWLHESFPNRSELLSALGRLDLRVSRLQLVVEAIESVLMLPARGSRGEEAADCVVNLRARTVYDDVETGRRVVSGPRRTEWTIRFEWPEAEPTS